jgi:undecaprenyl-diphosphatase
MSVVEGLTEFIPVSSTFHLIQTAQLLHIPQDEFVKLFEVAIQAGAVCSLFFLFKREVWFTKRLYLKLLVSTIPALIGGFMFHSVIKDVLFESVQSITLVFIAVGGIFLLVERSICIKLDFLFFQFG